MAIDTERVTGTFERNGINTMLPAPKLLFLIDPLA